MSSALMFMAIEVLVGESPPGGPVRNMYAHL